jgi:hypothetical protein
MIEFSWRYGVVGAYRDRNEPAWRVYPLPFVRITFRSRKVLSAKDMERLASLRPGESYKGFTAAYPGLKNDAEQA